MGGLILWLIVTLLLISCSSVAAYSISICLLLSYFGENDLTCIHFIYFNHQEATVVLDITIQFVASDDNKYSVAT